MKLFVATKAVIENDSGQILILRESSKYEEGTQAGKYDFPGGRIDPKESLFEALQREVSEESGLSVDVGSIFHVSEKFQEIKGEQCHIVRLYFACRATSIDVALSDDHDHFAWVDPLKHTAHNLIDTEHEVVEKYWAHCNTNV